MSGAGCTFARERLAGHGVPAILLPVVLLLLGAVSALADDTLADDSVLAPTLEDLQISSSEAMEVIVFVASGEGLSCSPRSLENPPRLVLDFPGARSLIPDRELPSGLNLLSDLGIEEVGLGAGRRTRVILHLKRPVQVEMADAPGLVTVLLRPEAGDPALEEPPPAASGVEQAAPVEAAQASDGELIPLFLTVAGNPAPSAAEGPQPPADRLETGQAQLVGADGGEIPLGPHDLLLVKVFGVESLDRRVRIATDGTLSLPLVGEVPAAGLTRRELEAELSRRLSDGFVRDAQVSVLVEEYLSRQISVSGAVRRPGAFELLRPTTLLEVLALAGGVLEDRAAARILIVRQRPPGPAAPIEVLRDPLESGRLEVNLPLQPGDLIHVPFEEMLEILVRGRVRQPDRYRVPASGGVTILRAVMLAGGTSGMRAGRRTEILRHQQDGQAITLEVNLKRIRDGKDPDLPLQTDDIVVVH